MSDSLKAVSEIAAPIRVIEFGEEIGVPGRVDRVAVTDLIVDTRYQRAIEPAGTRNIRRIVEGFRWEKFEPLIVAPSPDWPGKFAVIDGQHRAVAAWLHPDITEVPVVVHELTPKEQARAFRDVNKNRTKIGPLHIYRAGLISGDPKAIGVEAVTKAAGVEVQVCNRSKANMKPNELVCVNAISQSLKKSGFEAVSRALLCLKRAAKGYDFTLMSAWAVKVVSRCLELHRGVTNEQMVSALQDIDLDDYRADMNGQRVSLQKKIDSAAGRLAHLATGSGTVAA